ncbi:citrate/2-methylcitrate synthase [Thalassospira xiamenensis]|nr:citrate/2-methylcitrate synthase [Thalassospira xiamenensis]
MKNLDDPMNETAFFTLSAQEVCAATGISRDTLYAYVSRGIVRAIAHPGDARKSLYDHRDVRKIIAGKKRGRSRQSVAASTIDWGEPILVSKITRIADGRFFYRGRDAVGLSDTMTLEDAARLLAGLRVDQDRCCAPDFIPANHATPFDRMIAMMAGEVTNHPAGNGRPAAAKLMRLAALAAAGMRDDGESPIHVMLARAWSKRPEAVDLLRRALVLCADHELNASAYAVRVAASAGASVPASLLAGLATLSGSRHGGLTPRCRAWMDRVEKRKIDPVQDGVPPGFGHPLYPDGDPRTRAIMQSCGQVGDAFWARIADRVTDETGQYPSLDFGLALLERELDLPKGAGLGIFAVGRMAGWIAHLFEQRQSGKIIRPRAAVAG